MLAWAECKEATFQRFWRSGAACFTDALFVHSSSSLPHELAAPVL